jgi:hypothetical protein
MTPEELDLLRARSTAVASKALLRFSVELIKGGAWPPPGHARSDVLRSIELKLRELRKDIQQVTFAEFHPAESDLWAGELQDALDTLSAEFLEMLRLDSMPGGALAS